MYISFKTYNSDTQKLNFNFKSKTSAVKVVKNKIFQKNIQERNNSIIEMLKQGMTREAVAEKICNDYKSYYRFRWKKNIRFCS